MIEQRDLRAAAFAAVLSGVVALAMPVEFLSLLALAPLAFFLPGYALAAATLVRSETDWPRTLVYSVGLSLAVLAIGGIPLNYLGGLTPLSWTLLLVAVTLVASLVGDARPAFPGLPERTLPALPRPTPGAAALAGVGLVAVIVAVVLAFVPLGASHAIGFSELWLRPELTPAGKTVAIGVGSEEKQTTGYILTTRFGAAAAPIVQRLILEPGEKRAVSVPAPATATGGLRPVPVSVDLALADKPHRVYRHVYGWIPQTRRHSG